MENNRNLFLTIGLSVAILAIWQVLFINPRIEAERQAQLELEAQQQVSQTVQGATGVTSSGDVPAPVAGAGAGDQGAVPGAVGGAQINRDAAVSAAQRVDIQTPTVFGSLNLKGARFDDLTLVDYRETVDPTSDQVVLLSPLEAERAYFAEFGYTGLEGAPGPDTDWTLASGEALTPTSPIVLTFEAPNGVVYERQVSVDENYMFTMTDTITNNGDGAVALFGYGRSTRYFKPDVASIYILHEGLIGVHGEDGLEEWTFGEMESEGTFVPGKATDGWIGITDKYWATALIPTQGTSFQPKYSYFTDGRARFQSDFLSDAVTINAGQSAVVENRLFAGAKQTRIIDAYEADLGIRQFELMIDWGWFHFITKPLYYLLEWLFRMFGNFGVAILATTVIIKLIFFPLANKSYASMARMKVVQPKMQELKERYGEDREKLQKAMMELYKKEKINPIAGCWPVLIQIPVFFALYKVLYVTIEMRHAPFFGWIQDLSAPDPTSIFNLFGLLPFDPSAVPLIGILLAVGVWPLLMGITMFVQMQMNPAPPDPTQQMIFRWMPIVFTFMLAQFSAGLVIYWAWNNFLSILQQGFIMKRHGAEIALWDNLRSMFKKKAEPAE
ncbi:MAG: membrane protein insertase YidC [Pseudomonadota bacterium]